MPYSGLLYLESLPLQQSTADLYLHSGDTQTQFCFSLCGVSGYCCAQGLFEPSEHLWSVWRLILNINLPSYCLSGASLPLDVGYLLT